MFRNTSQIRFRFVTKSKPKISKSLTVFFFISQFFFGINFGFSQIFKKKYRSLAQRFTICLSVFYILNLAAPFVYIPLHFTMWFNIVEYPAYFIVLNTLKYTVYNFLCEMHEIYTLKTSELLVANFIALFYLMFMFVVKIIVNVVNCLATSSYCQAYNVTHLSFYCIPDYGMDVLAVTQILIYYYFQSHAKHLRELLAKSVKNVNIVETKYIAIAACYDKIRNLYDKMTFLELFIGVPKMMVTLWWMLLYMTKTNALLPVLTELIFGSHIAVQIALPAITAEIVNSQINAIQVLLTEYLRIESDEQAKADIVRVSKYIKHRPLNHLVLRFIPIDLRQIISVFSLCTTYFIVIIQFTHLID